MVENSFAEKDMMRRIHLLVLLILLFEVSDAQNSPGKSYRNFPLIMSVQFHSLSYPLKDIRTNFNNIGLGIGTELALGNKHNWAQQFHFTWYRNREAGNGIILYTQSAWRPGIAGNIYTELKAGVGFTHNYRPVEAYSQQNGQWTSAGKNGRWLLTVPAGVSIGYHKYSPGTYAAPYVSYQLLFSTPYADGIPVVPFSLLQLGTSIHLSSKKQ